MDDLKLKAAWQAANAKLEQTMTITRKQTAEITDLKVQSLLSSLKPVKVLAIIIGIAWVIFVDTLIVSWYEVAGPFFLASAIIQVLITKLAIGLYVYHLILIHQVDISAPVFESLEQLARLKSSTLWVARILFLQLPLWTTFYWNQNMLHNGHTLLWLLQGVVTIGFAWLAIWLFRNIRYDNRNKRWFQLLFRGKEWDSVLQSIGLLQEIEAYKREDLKS